MNAKAEYVLEWLSQYQHEVLCGLLNHPELCKLVTTHLFSGSPAGICVVKALQAGNRGLKDISFSAAKIAKVHWTKFPIPTLADMAFFGKGMTEGMVIRRIERLKSFARRVYLETKPQRSATHAG